MTYLPKFPFKVILIPRLSRLSQEYVDKLRHFAICVPLQDSRSEVTAETLNQHSNFYAEGAFGRDSMTFFSNLQALARRPRSLLLKSITLVFNDPIMQEVPSIKPNRGVARTFNEIDIHTEGSGELWTSRIDYCKWKLTQPHDPRDNAYSLAERRMPNCTWGAPDFEIRMRTADRIYAPEWIVCC
jgi:hypothetical protein